MKLLVLDNYDSFVYNLAQALRSLGTQLQVVRNDAWTLAEVRAFAPDAIVISPGPGRPEDPRYFGICGRVVRELGRELPMLGVCLGHQGMVHAFGGQVVRAAQVMHGKCSPIYHLGGWLLAGLPQGFMAMRYHSLVVAPELPECFAVDAWTADDTIMAVSHRDAPMHGVQFHPESIGTPLGPRVLDNFLRLAREFRARRATPP
jgi:anthranilate synthase/aminodeoxychorismate synthase-like glutamine amidotransferase